MSAVTEALPLPDLYYHYPNQDYWMPDSRAKWIRITEASAKRFLKSKGYGASIESGFSDVDQALLRIQQEQNVAYANRLAGYEAGCHEMNGNKILVTESPKPIEPREGEWPLIAHILEGMLNIEPEDQRPYLFGWLKLSLEMYATGKWMAGQVVAFAGPKNSAKSLFQGLLTEMFGGRCAIPFRYMTGGSNFNADLFQGEHLVVDDDCESIDFKARRHFGSEIKKVAVKGVHQCHGKNKDGIILQPLWRMSISLNDDPERLLVLPPIADDIDDKIMLFKVGKQPMPMPTETPEQRDVFWKALIAELPAFVHFLFQYEIPKELCVGRFGVKHYHHPDILQALTETAPEGRLLNLIDQRLFGSDPFGRSNREAYEFTALQLENLLTAENSPVTREARQLLTYSTACGAYLGRLAKDSNTCHRVTKRTIHGQAIWKIHPPLETRAGTPGLGEGVDTLLISTPKIIDMGSQTVTGNTGLAMKGPHPIHPSTPTSSGYGSLILSEGADGRRLAGNEDPLSALIAQME